MYIGSCPFVIYYTFFYSNKDNSMIKRFISTVITGPYAREAVTPTKVPIIFVKLGLIMVHLRGIFSNPPPHNFCDRYANLC